MRHEDKERLERWKKETLSAITAELAAESEELRLKPLADFNVFIGALGRKASAGFMSVFGFTAEEELDAMDKELKAAHIAFIVLALNSALPPDHPYLVALVFSDPTTQFRMCVLERKAIPGAHDMVSRDIIPFLRITNAAIGEKAKIRFRPVDAEYFHGGDNLEDLYKL